MPTLRFIPRGLASEVVKLGEIAVGEIIPFPGRRQRATWKIQLTGAEVTSGPSASFEAARKKIVHEVEQWRERAGEIGCVRIDIDETLKGRDA